MNGIFNLQESKISSVPAPNNSYAIAQKKDLSCGLSVSSS